MLMPARGNSASTKQGMKSVTVMRCDSNANAHIVHAVKGSVIKIFLRG
jgi:hypothetical protein